MRSRGRKPLVYCFQNLRETQRKPVSKGDSIISVVQLSKILERMIAMQETRLPFDDTVTVAKGHFGNFMIHHSHKSKTREHIPLKKIVRTGSEEPIFSATYFWCLESNSG